jgi:hypothetical protein
MLIAALLKHAGPAPAHGLPSHNGGAAGTQAGKTFNALKGAITSGDSSRTQAALHDVRKLLAGAGSIGAANSVQNQLNRIGAALKSGGSGGIHSSATPATSPSSSTLRRT